MILWSRAQDVDINLNTNWYSANVSKYTYMQW